MKDKKAKISNYSTLKFLKAKNGIKIHKICSSLLFSVLYIAADRNWNVVATGPSLSRVMGETVIGEKLDSLFHMSRPLDTDLEDYHAKYSNVLVFLTDTKRQLKYRGQLF